MTTATLVSPLRSRLAVCLVFVILGSTQGSWFSRIPDIRRAVGLDDTQWGLANTASTAGDVVALTLITVLIGRVGVRRLSLAATTVVLANAPFLASASAPAALITGLATWGFSATFLSTPMNTQAVAVERRYGHPLISTIHACYSCGVLAGGALGTLAAAADVRPGVQLAVNSGVLAALLVVTARWQPDEPPQPPAEKRPLRHRFTPQLLLLAAIAFLASFLEGAMGQWSAIYANDTLGASTALAAAAYTGFTVTMLVARLLGDRLIARFGRREFLRSALLTSAAGIALALAFRSLPLAMTGMALVGLGVACAMPVVMGLAGRQPDVSSGESLSVIVIGQWPGFLLAGPVVGVLAGATSLRFALVSLIVAGVGAALLVGRVRE